MPSDSSGAMTAQQRLDDAYQRGNRSVLVLALSPVQLQRFCRAVIAQAQAACARVLPYLERRGDRCAAEAVAAAQAWLDHGAWPSDAIQRRFDDFYNPFWLHLTTVSADRYECATAAAYCTERAVQAAHSGDWAMACREATMVVDVVAQADRTSHAAARADAERWYVEVAWALLQDAEPPVWPSGPPILVP